MGAVLGGGARFSVAAATAGGHAYFLASSVAWSTDSRLILIIGTYYLCILTFEYYFFFDRINRENITLLYMMERHRIILCTYIYMI